MLFMTVKYIFAYDAGRAISLILAAEKLEILYFHCDRHFGFSTWINDSRMIKCIQCKLTLALTLLFLAFYFDLQGKKKQARSFMLARVANFSQLSVKWATNLDFACKRSYLHTKTHFWSFRPQQLLSSSTQLILVLHKI